MRLPRYIRAYGANALLLEWEQRIAPDINRGVHAYALWLRQHPAVLECVPAYASLLLTFTGGEPVAYALRELITGRQPAELANNSGYVHDIPVCYGGPYGPDLEEVAERCGLSPERVVALHSERKYLVYLLGFRPGFAFMGETHAQLTIPRRAAPRPRVAAGAVGVAGRQTGIYPTPSPGGWQLIGRCPLPVLDDATAATRFRPGDHVRFRPVSAPEFQSLQSTPPSWPIR